MPVQQSEIFRNSDGKDVGTGLWIPDSKPEGKLRLRDTLTTRIDEKDVREILADPRRKSARERFPPKKWTRNQSNVGSCNGYSCAGALARARVSIGQPIEFLSGEFIYAGINGGRDQGSMLHDGEDWLKARGSCPESLVKHKTYLWRNINQAAKDAAPNFKAIDTFDIDDEMELVVSAALGVPAVVAVHFSREMQQLDTHGVAGWTRGPGNHSVGVDDVRWRAGRWEFDYFNSHGLRYGQDGKAWLVWASHFAQPNKYHRFFAVRSTVDNQSDDFTVPKPLSVA